MNGERLQTGVPLGVTDDGKTRVLVVDDDRRMVRTISDILRVKGFMTDTAYTGEEAVEKVKACCPDCVLMDVRMPGMDGIETMRRIKVVSQHLPVIMMSAYATDDQVAEAKGLGAYTVLTKPVDIQVVLSFLSLVRRGTSVLVVDDDPIFCRTMTDILESRAYVVETESDPGKVLVRLAQTYKLVVILDMRLGDADGVTLLASIMANYPTKPVVLVTGYGEQMANSLRQGLKIGAYAYLYKPFETVDLVSLIEEIRRKKLRAFLGES